MVSKPSVIQTPKCFSRSSTEAYSPRFHIPMEEDSSHDAFQTLVNAAVAQQSLLIPESEEKRNSVLNLSKSDAHKQQPVKDKQSIEGLEQRTLLDMHVRPRSESANNPEQVSDRFKLSEKQNQNKADQRSAVEKETDSGERTVFDLSKPHKADTLAGEAINTRSSFTKEQFEKELRQQKRKPIDQSGKSDHLPEIPKNRSKAQLMELSDNEASRLFSQSFQKDDAVRCELTAANLIDVIITRQMNQSGDNLKAKPSLQSSLPSTSSSSSSSSNLIRSGLNSSNSGGNGNNQEDNNYICQPIMISAKEDNLANLSLIGKNKEDQELTSKPLTFKSDGLIKSMTFKNHIESFISKSYNNDKKLIHEGQSNTSTTSNSSICEPSLASGKGLHSPVSFQSINTKQLPSPRSLEGIAASVAILPSSDSFSDVPYSNWKLRKALQEKYGQESDEKSCQLVNQDKLIQKVQNNSFLKPKSAHFNLDTVSAPSQNQDSQILPSSSFSYSSSSSPPTLSSSYSDASKSFKSSTISTSSNKSFISGICLSNSSCPVTTTSLPATSLSSSPPVSIANSNRLNKNQPFVEYVKNRIEEVMRTTSDDNQNKLDTYSNLNETKNNENQPTKEESKEDVNEKSSLVSNKEDNCSVLELNREPKENEEFDYILKKKLKLRLMDKVESVEVGDKAINQLSNTNPVLNSSSHSPSSTLINNQKLTSLNDTYKRSSALHTSSPPPLLSSVLSSSTTSSDSAPAPAPAAVSSPALAPVLAPASASGSSSASSSSLSVADKEVTTPWNAEANVAIEQHDHHTDNLTSPGEMVIDESIVNTDSSQLAQNETKSNQSTSICDDNNHIRVSEASPLLLKNDPSKEDNLNLDSNTNKPFMTPSVLVFDSKQNIETSSVQEISISTKKDGIKCNQDEVKSSDNSLVNSSCEPKGNIT